MALPRLDRTVRVIGFDDAPFARADTHVSIAGVVCAGTRFEGMVWGRTERDGFGATDAIYALITASKYHPQLHGVLIDGIAVGGLSVIDLPRARLTGAIPTALDRSDAASADQAERGQQRLALVAGPMR